MNCPLCESQLAVGKGTQLDPSDGITVWCPNHQCPAQEVSGHGSNEKAAFQIVKEKYGQRND